MTRFFRQTIIRRNVLAAALCMMMLLLAQPAGAQASTITISGNAPSLVVYMAIAGSAPMSVADASTTYTVLTDVAGQRITAALDAALPAGVTLEVELAAPPGAVSSGRVTLSLTPQAVVRDIPAGEFTGLSISYRLSATTSAGSVSADSRSVTLAITP